jgi:DNA-binding NtrC family response regulator
VPVLARHFLAREKAKQTVAFGFMYALTLYDWPFNVRELASVVSRAAAVAAGKTLELAHLSEPVREHFSQRTEGTGAPPAPVEGLEPRKKRPDKDELVALLQKANGNIAAVARTLNRERALVHRWLKDAGVDPETFR